MTAFRRIFPFVSALVLLGLAIPAAHAQAAKGATAPKSQVAAANTGGKWTCLSRQTVEIAPVSFDVRGQPSWVVVYRVKGEIIASQRVNERELEQLKRSPCGEDDSVAIG
jgi:hypothetical protein